MRSLYSAQKVQSIRQQPVRYIREPGPRLPERDFVHEADGAGVRNLWRMEQHDDFFRHLAADEPLRRSCMESRCCLKDIQPDVRRGSVGRDRAGKNELASEPIFADLLTPRRDLARVKRIVEMAQCTA